MRLERCILNMVNVTDNSTGNITLPTETFNNIPTSPCKFIAVKKKKSEFIKLLPIVDPDSHAYEVYCEVASDHISTLIFNLSKIAEKNRDIKFLQELEGICTGQDGKYPCTFDGFVLIKGDVDGIVASIKNKLSNIRSDDGEIKVVKSMSITKLD